MDLKDIFNTTDEVDPLTINVGDAFIGNTMPADFQTGIRKIEDLQRPLLERKNKLMEQLYEPDHLSFGGAVAQALVGFLPAILGKTLAGNVGGAIGARAGIQGLGQYDTISKAYRADEQKQNAAEAKTLEDKYNNYEALKKTLLTGGMVRGNQEEQRKYEDTRRRPGGDIYDYEREKMALQHRYRIGEIALSKAGGDSASDPALIATTKYAIEQRFKDQPELAKQLIDKLGTNPSNRSIEEMSRQLGLRDVEKRDSSLTETSSARLYDRVVKPVEKDLNKDFDSAKNLLALVDQNTGLTAGAVRGQWARVVAGEKGVLTDRDINRNLSENAQSALAKLTNWFNNAPSDETLTPEYKQMIKDVLLESAQIQLEKYATIDNQLKELAPTISKYAYEQNPQFFSGWTAPGKERLNQLLGKQSSGISTPQFTREEIERKKAEIRARGGR